MSDEPKIDKPSDPRIKDIIDYFCTAYQQRFKSKYTVSRGKDGKTFKALLDDHSPEILEKCIDLFFADNAKFVKEAGHTIGVFRSRINQYMQQVASRQSAASPRNDPEDLSHFRHKEQPC